MCQFLEELRRSMKKTRNDELYKSASVPSKILLDIVGPIAFTAGYVKGFISAIIDYMKGE